MGRDPILDVEENLGSKDGDRTSLNTEEAKEKNVVISDGCERGEEAKRVYSRKELEDLRFIGMEEQTKKWVKGYYFGLDYNLRKDYDDCVALRHIAKGKAAMISGSNEFNGLDLADYSWAQSLKEVTVDIFVPYSTRKRCICCDISTGHIKVGRKGEHPIIDGRFYGGVKVHDSFWTFENLDECWKSISIYLAKNKMGWWKYLVKGEPGIALEKVKPKLADLDPDSQSSSEDMMAVDEAEEENVSDDEEFLHHGGIAFDKLDLPGYDSE